MKRIFLPAVALVAAATGLSFSGAAEACSAPPYATLTIVNKTPWALVIGPRSDQKSVWGCSSNGPNFPSQCTGTYRQQGSINVYGTAQPGGSVVASDDERWPSDGYYHIDINFHKSTSQWTAQHDISLQAKIPAGGEDSDTRDGWTSKVTVETAGFDSDCSQDRFVVTIYKQ